MMNGMPNNSAPSAPKPEPKTEPEDGGALPNDILRLLNDNDNPVPSNVPPAKNDPVSCGVCQKDVSFGYLIPTFVKSPSDLSQYRYRRTGAMFLMQQMVQTDLCGDQ